MSTSKRKIVLRKKVTLAALSIGLTALASTPLYSAVSAPPLSVVNAYYGETQGTMTLSQLIASGATSHLTHLTYAFAQGTSSNPCTGSPFAANASDVTALRSEGVRVLISIGGENSGSQFSAALQSQTPAQFAHSCVTTLASSFPGTFDGIDIGWEFPSSTTDESNLNLLLAAFRSELNTYATNKGLSKAWLTAAVGPSSEPSPFGWAYIDFTGSKTGTVGANSSVDFYNVEFYNYAYGTGSPDTQSNAPLGPIGGDIYGNPNQYAADGLNKPVAQGGGGVPLNQIVLGIPFYGVHYTGVTSGSNLGSTGTMDPPTTFSGVPPYYYIEGLIQVQPTRFQSCSAASGDPNYGSAWSWNSSTKNFWEYDDDVTITQKIQYAQSNTLGGVFAWNLQHDTVLASELNSLKSTANTIFSDVTNMAPAYAPNGITYNRGK